MSAVKSFLGIEFWAENGVVYLSNERAAEGKDYNSLSLEERLKIFKGLPPKVFLKRAIMLGALFLRARAAGVATAVSEPEIYGFLNDAQEVYRKAVEQGAVDSDEADDYKLRHRIYRKPQIIVPGITTSTQEEIKTPIKPIQTKEEYKKILLEGF